LSSAAALWRWSSRALRRPPAPAGLQSVGAPDLEPAVRSAALDGFVFSLHSHLERPVVDSAIGLVPWLLQSAGAALGEQRTRLRPVDFVAISFRDDDRPVCVSAGARGGVGSGERCSQPNAENDDSTNRGQRSTAEEHGCRSLQSVLPIAEYPLSSREFVCARPHITRNGREKKANSPAVSARA